MREIKTSSTSGIKTGLITKSSMVSCKENGLQDSMNCSRNIVPDLRVCRRNDARTQMESETDGKSHGMQLDQRRTRSKSLNTLRLFMPPLRNHLLMRVLKIRRLRKDFIRSRSSQEKQGLPWVTSPHYQNGNVVKLVGANINAKKRRVIEVGVKPRRKGNKVYCVSRRSQANKGKPNHLNGVKKARALCSDGSERVGSDLSVVRIGGQFEDSGEGLNGCQHLKPSHHSETSFMGTTRSTGLTSCRDNRLLVHKDIVADLNDSSNVQSINEKSTNGYLDAVTKEFEIQIEQRKLQVSGSSVGLSCEMSSHLDGNTVPSTSGLYGAEVPCWSDVSGAAIRGRDSLVGTEIKHCGHILDEWDQEYDSGKRKKVRRMMEGQVASARKIESSRQQNIFQEFSNSKLHLTNGGHKRPLKQGGRSVIKRPKTNF